MQELYVGLMRRKFVQDKVHFHPRLEPVEREQGNSFLNPEEVKFSKISNNRNFLFSGISAKKVL